MAKKAYSKPMLKSEAFVPQSYVAACVDTNMVYKFECNAGVSRWYDVIEDTNDNGVLDGSWKYHLFSGWEWSGDDKYRSVYHPCGKTHDASTTDEFINGFMTTRNSLTGEITSTTKVIIWTDNGTNTHCTTNLNMSSWETAKS